MKIFLQYLTLKQNNCSDQTKVQSTNLYITATYSSYSIRDF